MLLGCLVHNNIRLSTNPSSCKPRTHYIDHSLDLNAFKVTLSSSGIVHTLTKSVNLRSYILGTCDCIKYPITLQEHHLQVMQRGAPRTFGISNRSYSGHISPIVPHTFERIEDIGRVISVLLCPNLPGGRAPHWAEQGHYFTAVTVSPPSIFLSICSIFNSEQCNFRHCSVCLIFALHLAEQGLYFTAVTVSLPSIFFSISSIFLLQFRALQFPSLFSKVYICTAFG